MARLSAPILRLFQAALEGDLTTIESLAGEGVDLNSVNNAGLTAMHIAASMGRKEVVARLLNLGASPDLKTHAGFSVRDLGLINESKMSLAPFSEDDLKTLCMALTLARERQRQCLKFYVTGAGGAQRGAEIDASHASLQWEKYNALLKRIMIHRKGEDDVPSEDGA